MKKIFAAVVMSVFLVAAGSGWATQITINRYANYSYGSGGEFNIAGFGAATNSLYYTDALVNGGFESFCLEKDEYISLPGTYNAVINPNYQAYGGGVNTNTGDTISRGTAYLYDLFSRGELLNVYGYSYNYTPGAGRQTSARDLQNAIWWLEDEGGSLTRSYRKILTGQFGSTDDAKQDIDINMNYGVGVLNLTTLTGGPAQDQLVRIPASVPEPGTLLLLGLGLIGLSGVRRISKRK
jgi:hypothetical protein